ncbi:hypothetical protein N7467_001210 [Penicillium canescens]|nr:hypothetical protein N7467_001210 [Penicillium canescens]
MYNMVNPSASQSICEKYGDAQHQHANCFIDVIITETSLLAMVQREEAIEQQLRLLRNLPEPENENLKPQTTERGAYRYQTKDILPRLEPLGT